MKNYTKIENALFYPNQLSIQARYLYCVLMKFCGKNDSCYPGQTSLAKILGKSVRHVRELVRELESEGLVATRRRGFNRPNTYLVAKSLNLMDGNCGSGQIGSTVPIHDVIRLPDKSTYRKGKDKKRKDNFEKFRNSLKAKRVIK